MKRLAGEHVRSVLNEQEKLNAELEKPRKKLNSWSKELNKREALTEREKQKLDEDKQKNDVQNNSLHMASIEQKKADESLLRLLEEQKREKEETLKKVLELERQLDAKRKLEMEIDELKQKLHVMKHLGDEDDVAVQQKIKDMNNELQTKMEEMEDVESLNQTLVVKERQSNDELQEARKELIKGSQDMLSCARKLARTLSLIQKNVLETRKMQCLAGEHVRRVLNEQEKLNAELEKRRKMLDSCYKELNKRVSLIEQEKPKLDQEKKEREKEVALKNALELETQLDAKLKLEMEIEELKGKLQVMKHLGDEDDAAVQQKIKDMNNELLAKMEEMDHMEDLNQTLMVKERQTNDELREALNELIKGKLKVMKHFGDEDDAAVQEKIKERNNELPTKMEEMNDLEILNQTLMVQERQTNDKLQEAYKELIKSGRTSIGVKRMVETYMKAVLEKSKQKKNQLQTKMEEMDDIENLNQTLMVKERQTYDELREALKELMKGELKAMKCFGDEDDAAVQEKIKKRNNELPTKIEEMNDLEILNLTLMFKEGQTNDELQEAYKELIKSGYTSIGVKRMGETNMKAVHKLKNPDWHVVQVDDDHKEVINENDKLLKNSKAERGNGEFDAVVTAFKEMNEYNPSGRYFVNKLLDFKDNRKLEKGIFLLMKLVLLMMVLIGVILMAGDIMLTKVPLLLTFP